MPRLKRRQFLQSTGSLLATLGLSQLDIQRQGDRYARVLAQGTPRKLALLVGINAYQDAPLRGCLIDVDMQRQLLINRFGFNPNDILTLTDGQATRQGILTAFEEHLIKQAKPGDVVVFHFSGHGSQVVDPDKDFPDGLNSTFVPVDRLFSPSTRTQGGVVQDIMGHTLFLLMSALQTEDVTVVLDSCHSGGGTRGNIKVRSLRGGSQHQAVNAEQEYQQQWLSKLKLSPDEFKRRRRLGVAKGVVIASAKREQLAADAAFNDFFAGAFTYTMTQYLWQQTRNNPVVSVFANVARTTTKSSFTRQEPVVEVKPNSNYDRRPVYFVEQQMPSAEAVILGVEGDRAQVWLGGINPKSLQAFEQGAVLSVVDAQGTQKGQVQLESRQQLIGRGKLLGTAQPGTFLQEQVRGIPSNITLRIGLDPSLGNDTPAAKQALQAVRRIEALPLQQQEVQYILGRMTDAYYQDLQRQRIAKLPPIGSIGLFSPGLELIPDSFGAAGETVTAAVNRLQAKLKSLLAARLVKLILNPDSSRLNVTAAMSREDQKEVIASTFTVRGSSIGKGSPSNQPPQVLPADASKLPLGTRVQFRINNNEPRDLYISILVIDPTGEISVIFPNQWVVTDDVMRVKAGQMIQIPNPQDDSFTLVAQEPKGVAEVLIIASATPMSKALQALRDVAVRGGSRRGPVTPNEPTQVIGNLLDDLDEGTRGSRTQGQNQGVKSVNTSQMAAMSITFEVI
ncbi:MAG TPA: peptidase C14, caspase catalytic subunit p20 [Cyanobacteria bacterium UBA8543]|nr:peptidase C14, caspase catalytic subunit p20 [Cyanobacteria bacterium UBA8543]